jgi:hypothetical protein
MSYVALTVGGRYLHLCRLGEETRLCGGATTLEPQAIFERVRLAHGRVALRSLDGRYLTMRPDPGQNFGLYAEEEFTPHAAFEEILWPNEQISFRSHDLTYVGVEARDGAPVTVNRTEPTASERFFYVEVPVATVPRQRTGSSQPAPAQDTATR